MGLSTRCFSGATFSCNASSLIVHILELRGNHFLCLARRCQVPQLTFKAKEALNPFLIFSSFRDLAFSSPGQPPVVWGTVGRLVSAASSQLGSQWPVNGRGGGGPVAGKEPDTPAPPGMSGHQCTRGGYR